MTLFIHLSMHAADLGRSQCASQGLKEKCRELAMAYFKAPLPSQMLCQLQFNENNFNYCSQLQSLMPTGRGYHISFSVGAIVIIFICHKK